MNLQSLMKQAQSMQNKLLTAKNEIDKKEFVGKSELVEVKMNGKKEMLSIKIDKNSSLDADDIEILEDMIVLATNEAVKKIDKEINEKLGSQAGNLSSFM